MKTEKEIEKKITEILNNTFGILDRNNFVNPARRISVNTIRLVVNAMEWCLGKSSELGILKPRGGKNARM